MELYKLGKIQKMIFLIMRLLEFNIELKSYICLKLLANDFN